MSYNWTAIKNEYLSTKISLRDIAKKYGCGRTTIEARSRRENWGEQKRRVKGRIETETEAKVIEKVATMEAKRRLKQYELNDKITDYLEELLSSQEVFEAYMSASAGKFLKMYMDTLEKSELMKRREDGVISKLEQERLKIEQERLKIEQRRGDAEAERAGESGVVLMPAVMEPTEPPELAVKDGDDDE